MASTFISQMLLHSKMVFNSDAKHLDETLKKNQSIIWIFSNIQMFGTMIQKSFHPST